MKNLTRLLKNLNKFWIRSQVPSKEPSEFHKIDKFVIFLICLVIAIASSYQLIAGQEIKIEIVFTWLITFTEILLCCGILIIFAKKENTIVNSRQIILITGLLMIAQFIKLNLNNLNPLSIVVPPALIISQGMGTLTSLTWVSIACFNWPNASNGINAQLLLITFMSSSIVSILGGRMRSRAQLLQISLLVPLGALISQWLVLIANSNKAVNLSPIDKSYINFENILSDSILLSFLMLGTILIMPILESAFGLLTKAKLLELADQENPLLRRLSIEAPGTFEHTLLIGGLAEEATRMIGGNIDLVKTGALYHDIGKLHAPNWFIENQNGENNPHDELNDPIISAEILQDHVDQGLKFARKYRLPKPIASFIPEHQGTLKMGYFLHKAKEKYDNVSENDFRYKGPIPQSKETAILMLADGCEAALRAMDPNKKDSEAFKTISKIINSRKLDGQLLESNLSTGEIYLIKIAFLNVWKRIKHRRIQYPTDN